MFSVWLVSVVRSVPLWLVREVLYYITAMNRILLAAAVLAAALAVASCGGGGLFQQYEYQEDIYLALDGTATIYVNGSVAALDALRGASFDTSPAARLDRDAIRAFYTTPFMHVTQITQSRRNGRRFAHVRVNVDDIRRLSAAPPFRWARYEFLREGDEYIYRQTLGAASGKAVGSVGWTGRELVAFRLHLPSKITYHTNNNGMDNYLRGNILQWDQPLTERLRGTPLLLEARMQTQSILYRTILLFGGTFLAVAATFVIVIVAVLRGGKKKAGKAGGAGEAG